MKIVVVGLWHLGSVTAACLASLKHDVVGLDFEENVIKSLTAGHAPLFEPGLDDLLQQGLQRGHLSFTTDSVTALAGAEVVWITYDTPVRENDEADVDFVVQRVQKLFPFFRDGTTVLISSQLPVGTTRQLQHQCPDKSVMFYSVPENLRLGGALKVFLSPDRVVIGQVADSAASAQKIKTILEPVTKNILWMSAESAEMSKHALNAFLAMSVSFANELASICEHVGADAKEVERALKSDQRIGEKAYLAPGIAFAGGTLARDIIFLSQLAERHKLPIDLIPSIYRSNERHKDWLKRKMQNVLKKIEGRCFAVWGLAYKPGTNTPRRSLSIDLCRWLVDNGATIQAHDPAMKELPESFNGPMKLCESPLDACRNVDAVVVATAWPEYQAITAEQIVMAMPVPVVFDPNRFLANNLQRDPRIRYISVGSATTS